MNETYWMAFLNAIDATLRHGFEVNLIEEVRELPDTRKLRENYHQLVIGAGLDPRYSAGQCLKWTYAFAPRMREVCGQDVQITLGEVVHSHDGMTLFPCGSEVPFEMAKLGTVQEGRAIEFHAWWTVSGTTIVDPTLMYSFAAANPKKAQDYLRRGVLSGQPAEIHQYNYKPIGVGSLLVEQIDSSTKIGLLARNLTPSEMHFPRATVKR